MKRITTYTLLVALFAVITSIVCAQSPSSPNDGCDLHRTRLIPYPTADAAAARAMTKQRYMQPITEWSQPSEGTLRGEFTYPFSWVERQIFLRIEHAGCPYEVRINGKRAGGSTNGFGAAEYNITKLSREDKNSVEIRLLKSDEVAAIECFKEPETTLPDVYIISQPRVRVRDIFYHTTMGGDNSANVSFGVVMHNETLGNKVSRIYYDIYLNDTLRLVSGQRDVSLGMRGVDTMRFGATVADTMLWSDRSPVRISLRLKNRVEGRDVEFYDMPVALREVEYADGGFTINRQATDVVWRDMSPNVAVADVDNAYAGGCRAIRFTAGEVCDEVLSRCDELGVYVAVTAPINSWLSGVSRKRGKNPSNNPKWRADYVERTLQMAHTVKRHPSVIALFLADESSNGICLYESYLALKRIAGDLPVFYTDGGDEWNSDLL